jgi:hypothetical protein
VNLKRNQLVARKSTYFFKKLNNRAFQSRLSVKLKSLFVGFWPAGGKHYYNLNVLEGGIVLIRGKYIKETGCKMRL